MQLTGYQVKKLNDFMGGDYDAGVTIEELPERTLDPGTGDEPTVLPAGLWVWCTDYPEEGGVLLARDPDDFAVRNGLTPAEDDEAQAMNDLAPAP